MQDLELDYVRTRQVSAITGIPEGTLRRWRHENGGPFTTLRLHGSVLYSVAEVERYARQRGDRLRVTEDRR